MSDTDFTFGFRAEGVDEALRQAGRVEQANAGVARGAQQASQQMSRSASATLSSLSSLANVATRSEQTLQLLHSRMTGLAGGLGQLSSLLGTESQSGRVVGQMSRFAATGIQVGSAFGPVGGVLGGVTGALLGLGEALVPVPPAIRDVTNEANAGASAVIALGDAFDGAGERMRTFLDEVSTAGRQRGLQDLNAQITEIADRIAYLSSGRGSATEALDLPALRDRLAALQFQSEQEGATISGEINEVGRARRGGGGGPRDTFRSDGGAALRQMLADADAGGADALEFAAGLGSDAYAEKAQERFDAEKEQLQQLTRARREATAEQIRLEEMAAQAVQQFEAATHTSTDAVIQAWHDANEALAEASMDMLSTGDLLRVGMVSVGNQIADTIGGTMLNAFESALGAWLDGSKSFVEAAEEMARGVLKALVIESIVQAVTEGARAIASAASYDFSGAALHAAAAAAWAAVGAVAGGVGAAIGGFGGGGKDAPSASTAVTPTDASTSAQQSQPMVINVYPGGFITRRDVSAGIVDALNEAGRDGYRLDPGLVGG